MFTVDGLNIGLATLFVKGRVVNMILASNNKNKNEPIESDLKEWVDLILEANK